MCKCKMQEEIFRMWKLNDQSEVFILLVSKLFYLIKNCRNWLSVCGSVHSNSTIHRWNFTSFLSSTIKNKDNYTQNVFKNTKEMG